MAQKFFISFYKNKLCCLRKQRDQIFIEHISRFSEDVKPLDILEGQERIIVTGLCSSEVILRNISLKLKSKREILAALPFQVENFLPYPPQELILLPTLERQKDQTQISLLATSEKTLQSHLTGNIDPDIVSCIPLALFRYARYFFPGKNSFFLCHSETFIVVDGGKLQAFQSIKESDFDRVFALMQKKYPHIPEEMIRDGEKWEFAIVIGLALDAAISDERSAQFRQEKNQSRKTQKRKKKQLAYYFSLCLGFTLMMSFLGHLNLQKKESVICKILGFPKNTSLSKIAYELEEDLSKQQKEIISVCKHPKITEVLNWLSTHPKLREECTITRLHYQIFPSGKAGAQTKASNVKVELEFTTQNSRAAKEFHEALLRDRKFVDQKNDIRWSADHGIYRTTFMLKNKKIS